MKKNIATVTAIIAFGILAFFAGFQSNTNVEQKTIASETVVKPDPIEHCMYTAIKKFPTPENEKIAECISLTEKDQDFAENMLVDFIEDAVFYIN